MAPGVDGVDGVRGELWSIGWLVRWLTRNARREGLSCERLFVFHCERRIVGCLSICIICTGEQIRKHAQNLRKRKREKEERDYRETMDFDSFFLGLI